jgi:hypothetical protein
MWILMANFNYAIDNQICLLQLQMTLWPPWLAFSVFFICQSFLCAGTSPSLVTTSRIIQIG